MKRTLIAASAALLLLTGCTSADNSVSGMHELTSRFEESGGDCSGSEIMNPEIFYIDGDALRGCKHEIGSAMLITFNDGDERDEYLYSLEGTSVRIEVGDNWTISFLDDSITEDEWPSHGGELREIE